MNHQEIVDAFVGPPDSSSCPGCGRYTCDGSCAGAAKAHPVAEALPAFLSRMRSLPEPGWLVKDLVPDEGIVVWHGRPRSMKSLTAADVLLSLALGEKCALNNERFTIAGPVGVLWLAEEDPERLNAFRLGMMLAARETAPPDSFRLTVRPGWNLETPHGQSQLIAMINATSTSMTTPLRVLVIDPARASMPSIDGSPKDAALARAFLLTILRQTSIKVVLLPHHDTKPRADGKDDRSHAERASGGVTFSMADCMVNFQRVTDRETMAIPAAYKLGSDPKPFRIRFESETEEGEGFKGFLRATAESGDEAALEGDRVFRFVRDHPWLSTQEIADGSRVKGSTVRPALERLKADGAITSLTGEYAVAKGRHRNATLWGVL